MPPPELLLIHPPAVKATEPPLGCAVLAGALRQRGVAVEVIDANLAATLHLLDPQRAARAAGDEPSTTVRRALAQGARALALLRSPAALGSFPRYATAVRQLQTLLGCYGDGGERLTLGDYEHPRLSPFVPADLATMAAGREQTLFADYFENDLLPRIVAAQPIVVAISINYLPQVLPAFELAGLVRRALPTTRLIAGGGMVTTWRARLRAGVELPLFDHLVCGPGEGVLADLVRNGGGETLLDGVEVAFAPDYSDFPLADYLSPQPVLPFSASRGCYWNRCRFCPEAAAPTHPYAAAPAADLPDRLLELAARYGVKDFHLTDNAIPLPALRALAARSEELAALRWHGFVRFERPLLDPVLVDGLARSGCSLLQLGLESGAQGILDAMAKGTRLDEAAQILANLRRAGIATYVYVMVGMPGETTDDVAATRSFLLAHADDIGYLNIALMNLPRDAGLLAAAAAYGITENGLHDEAAPLGLYRRFTGSDGRGRGEGRRDLARLRGEPLLREILQRTPPWFTSNHAFFFPPWPDFAKKKARPPRVGKTG